MTGLRDTGNSPLTAPGACFSDLLAVVYTALDNIEDEETARGLRVEAERIEAEAKRG